MLHSSGERSSAYELTWSLDVKERTLELQYQIEAFEELYVSDRLWNLDASQKRVPDPLGVYRYVRDEHLWLVFAQAPTLPGVHPMLYYEPLSSKVPAGSIHGKAVSIALPVEEYSPLARRAAAPATLEHVSKVVFVLGYRRRSTLDAAPEPPPRETAASAGYVVYGPELMVSRMAVHALPVRRSAGDLARFMLPTETGG